MPSARTREELQALQAELSAAAASEPALKPARRRAAKAAAQPDATVEAEAEPAATEGAEAIDAGPGTLAEVQALIHTLQAAVQDATKSAGKTVTAYPIAALASAFLIGALVGRAWRK